MSSSIVNNKAELCHFDTINHDLFIKIISEAMSSTSSGTLIVKFMMQINRYTLVSKRWKNWIDKYFKHFIMSIPDDSVDSKIKLANIRKLSDFRVALKDRFIKHDNEIYRIKETDFKSDIKLWGVAQKHLGTHHLKWPRYYYIFGNVVITFKYRRLSKKKGKTEKLKNKATITFIFESTTNSQFSKKKNMKPNGALPIPYWKSQKTNNENIPYSKMSPWQKCIADNLSTGLIWYMMRVK